ncbi:MAG TPA: hypothetical protein PK264_10300 [Hyphomicrobiaceae bacterium]|nr:hypothetical protein [Hyphomicrobiaceae bacterium]
MRSISCFIVGAALGLVSSAALAFQENKATPAPGSTPPGAATVAPGAAAQPSGPAGTEIRIPGLGRIGTLPRLELGLDLLYGVGDAPATPGRPEDRTDDGVQIHGRIKHRF